MSDDESENAVGPDRRVCRLPGCGGPAAGVCINALPFDECPDVVEPAVTEDLDDSDRTVSSGSDFVLLPGGHALGATACDALLRQRGGTVVGLVAGPDVGKTTLIGTMYELLTRRRMVRHRFAGSETLRGYEERCHLARIASNSATADTLHTPTMAQLSFTHLRIARSEDRTDVVFSDRSGEHFQRTLDRPNEIAGFEELRRADVVLLLVDLPELLAAPHLQTSNLRKWVMAMGQNGILAGKVVRLVGTKADLVGPGGATAPRTLDELAADLSKRAGGAEVIAPDHCVPSTTGFD